MILLLEIEYLGMEATFGKKDSKIQVYLRGKAEDLELSITGRKEIKRYILFSSIQKM